MFPRSRIASNLVLLLVPLRFFFLALKFINSCLALHVRSIYRHLYGTFDFIFYYSNIVLYHQLKFWSICFALRTALSLFPAWCVKLSPGPFDIWFSL